MSVRLRRLMDKDAQYMLEWMHDEELVEFLSANFAEKTIEDCKRFIANSYDEDSDVNLAIVDDLDEYMGTVSLKHIDRINSSAEFAICTRRCSMGKGYAAAGMAEIIRMGHEELNIESIYWCVSKYNTRAVRFYDKNGYNRITAVPEYISDKYTEEQCEDFIWYKSK